MGKSYRRVIWLPADKTDADLDSVAKRLAENVQQQRRLSAQSPHILKFTSDLQRDDDCLFVEHEEATTYRLSVFDPGRSAADDDELLGWAAALADALRAAHDESSRIVHGGLSPGTLLTTPDGIRKVSDFGFAPSICSSIGTDEYINLAVGLPGSADPRLAGTGLWQILSPDAEHDDRICGFVDPQKYANMTLHTFEPGSDVIAAAFLLHLMAELNHPYLEDNQDLRLPALSEAMAYIFYDGSRRKELLESSDPRIEVWCNTVAKMLEHFAADRPTASEVASSFAEVGITPHTLADTQEKELDKIASCLTDHEFAAALDRSRTLAANAASEDIKEKAESFLRSADAGQRVSRAAELLGTENWRQAGAELEGIGGADLNPDLTARVAEVGTQFSQCRQADEQISAIDDALREKEVTAPSNAQEAAQIDAALGALEDALAQIKTGSAAPAAFQARIEELGQELRRRRELAKEIAASIEAEQKAARDWLAKLEAAFQADERDQCRDLLAGRSRLPIEHWPDDVLAAADSIQTSLEVADQTEAWILDLSEAVESAEQDHELLPKAQKVFEQKPALAEWPNHLRTEMEGLTKRLDTIKAIVADTQKAEEWIRQIRQAVEAQDWMAAKKALNSRPSIQHWPAAIKDKEQELGRIIDEHLELQQQVDAWLHTLQDAFDAERFSRVLELYTKPPVDGKSLPKKARKQADRLRADTEARIEAKRKEELAQRSDMVRDHVRSFVREAVSAALGDYIPAGSVESDVKEIVWDSADLDCVGSGEINISLKMGHDDSKPIFRDAITFKTVEGTPRIENAGDLEGAFITKARDAIAAFQLSAVSTFGTDLRKGLFPDAALDSSVEPPATQAEVTFAFLGPQKPKASLKTTLAWDRTNGCWSFADPAAAVQHAVAIAVAASKKLVKPHLLNASATLQQYSGALSTDVNATSQPPSQNIPSAITLQGDLVLTVNGDEPTSLLTFPIECHRIGEITVQPDLAAAEAHLNTIIIERQKTAQTSLLTDLENRLQSAQVKGARVHPTQKRIKAPVNSIEFRLKASGGVKHMLRAAWNRDIFQFEFGEEDEKALKALLNGAPDTKTATEEPAGSGRKLSKGGTKRAAAIVSAVLAVACAAVFGLQFLRSTETPIPGGNRNENGAAQPEPEPEPVSDNGGENNGIEEVDTTELARARTQQLMEQINERREGMSYLEDVQLASSSEAGTIEYYIPGLTDSVSIALTGQGKDLQLPEGTLARIDGELAALRRLRAEDFKTDLTSVFDRVVANAQFTELVDSANTSIEAGVPNWQLSADGRFWNADGEIATIQLGGGKSIEVRDISYRITDGKVVTFPDATEADPVASHLRAAFANGLLALMNTAASDWGDGAQTAGLPPDSVIGPEEQSDEFRLNLTMTIQLDNLFNRVFTASWNKESLSYRPAYRWETDLAPVISANTLVRLLNDTNARPAWVDQINVEAGQSRLFWERERSSDDRIRLATPAPWANLNAVSDPKALDSADLISFTLPLNEEQPGQEVPQIWPILAHYQAMRRQPSLFAGAGTDTGPDGFPWTNLPDQLTSLQAQQFQNISLAVEGPDNPSLTSEDTPQLRVTVGTSWAATAPEGGFSQEVVDSALNRLTAGRKLEYSVTIDRDEGAPSLTRLSWELQSPAADLSAVTDELTQMDTLLSDYVGRGRLEQEFINRLGNSRVVALQAEDAFRLLSEIWDIKPDRYTTLSPKTFTELCKQILDLEPLDVKTNAYRQQTQDPRVKRPQPTMLAEFFSGPEHLFAIAWSMRPDKDTAPLADGPVLMDLGTFPDVLTARQPGRDLLDPVFDQLTTAIRGGNDFDRTLGVLIACDEPMPPPDELVQARLSPKQTRLSDFRDSASAAEPEDRNWQTLQNLRDMRYWRCDYRLIKVLTDATRRPLADWSAPDEPARLAALYALYGIQATP